MKILCIGRNYFEHVKELHNPVPTEPIFFLKPETSLLKGNRPFRYPAFSRDVHYETEIVVKISKAGRQIDQEHAPDHYDQIGIGIDFTARDLQQIAKEKGLPWTLSKGFDMAAPLSPFLPKQLFPGIQQIRFHLNLNGKRVQSGNTSDMVFPVDFLISYVSGFMTLKKGDLIFTGTPAGVGPVRPGDRLEAFLEGRLMLKCEVK